MAIRYMNCVNAQKNIIAHKYLPHVSYEAGDTQGGSDTGNSLDKSDTDEIAANPKGIRMQRYATNREKLQIYLDKDDEISVTMLSSHSTKCVPWR